MNHIGRQATFTALGQQWTLAKWVRAVWFEFIEYAKTKLPDPRKDAEEILKVIPETDTATRVQVVRDALDRSRRMFVIGSPEMAEFLGSEDGACYSTYLLLRPNHPEITPDMVFEILKEVGDTQEFATAIARAAGQVPPKDISPGGDDSAGATGQPIPPTGSESTAKSAS